MKAIILCYHKVGTEAEEGRWLTARPDRLKAAVSFFHRRGFSLVAARDLAKSWDGRTVCFTFDDAYESAIRRVPPIFKEVGQAISATFYAVPGLVGKTSEWDGERATPLADWEFLRAVHDQGFEIGNHTANHARLAELSPNEQLQEIQIGHRMLCDQGLEPKSFCYPYGSENSSARETLRSQGYKIGLALGKRPAWATDDPLALPRIVVSFSDALPKLLYKIYVRPRLPAR